MFSCALVRFLFLDVLDELVMHRIRICYLDIRFAFAKRTIAKLEADLARLTKVEKSLRAQLMRFQFLKKKSRRVRNSSTGEPGDADDVGKHVTVQ